MNAVINKISTFILLVIVLTTISGENCWAKGSEVVIYKKNILTPIADGPSFNERGMASLRTFQEDIKITMGEPIGTENIKTVPLLIENKSDSTYKLGPVTANRLFKNGKCIANSMYRAEPTKHCPSELPPGGQCAYIFKGTLINSSEINSDTYVEVKVDKNNNGKWTTLKRRPWADIMFLVDKDFDFSRQEILSFKNVFPGTIKVTKIAIQGVGADDNVYPPKILSQDSFEVERDEVKEIIIPSQTESPKALKLIIDYKNDKYEEKSGIIQLANKAFVEDK